MKFSFVAISNNAKTGPIPVTTSSAESCPPSCPFNSGGCYAKMGPLAIHWSKITNGLRGVEWPEFLAAVRSIGFRKLWRHNQAGDLPGEGETIDFGMLSELVAANEGKRGFTYTHKSPVGKNKAAIFYANKNGFTVNLSGNSVGHADKLRALKIGPVVTVLPVEASNGPRQFISPAGNRVVICPATYRAGFNCEKCGICQNAKRETIIGFPAHGTAKRKAGEIAKGTR